MDWIPLLTEEQLGEIEKKSYEKTQAIFKHSTRCSISRMIKSRLEKSETPDDIDFNYLDLLKYRNISNEVAYHFSIRHESPQIILIKDGKAIYDESHSAIHIEDIIASAG